MVYPLIFFLIVVVTVREITDLQRNQGTEAGAIITQITDLLHRNQAADDLLVVFCSVSKLVKFFNKRIQVLVFYRFAQAAHKFLVVIKIVDGV